MAKQPQLNGQAPEKLAVQFAPFEFDMTDAQHIALAERLERDEHVAITVVGKVSVTSWKRREQRSRVSLPRSAEPPPRSDIRLTRRRDASIHPRSRATPDSAGRCHPGTPPLSPT